MSTQGRLGKQDSVPTGPVCLRTGLLLRNKLSDYKGVHVCANVAVHSLLWSAYYRLALIERRIQEDRNTRQSFKGAEKAMEERIRLSCDCLQTGCAIDVHYGGNDPALFSPNGEGKAHERRGVTFLKVRRLSLRQY